MFEPLNQNDQKDVLRNRGASLKPNLWFPLDVEAMRTRCTPVSPLLFTDTKFHLDRSFLKQRESLRLNSDHVRTASLR